MAHARDTIFALSSGRPPAAIGVVRISGARAGDALKALTGRVPEPRQAALVRVRDGGDEIDQALVLWFPGPASETGEDVAELQLHGGRAVIAAVLDALAKIPGLRPAEAGEFTRRAFENGKLDLTAVEGLADLVMAETQAQRRQALRQLQGSLGKRAEAWRQQIIKAMALVEARIDFPDESDVPNDLRTPTMAILAALHREIAAVLADEGRGERLHEGLVVAIAGPPNAGKSTLLNRLARREAAIVSPFAGTTRDVIEVHLDLGGYPVTLLDTAGIRETADPVEMEGVRRARARAEAADLVLWVVDAREPALTNIPRIKEGQSLWIVRNKADLLTGSTESKFINHLENSESPVINVPLRASTCEPIFITSMVASMGLRNLENALANYAANFLAGAESALITRARHRAALTEVVKALQRAQLPSASQNEELQAEELRLAARELARLTGRVDVEDVLDVIFRDFCIGK